MKLIEFSVTNFRSITKAHKINLNNFTVLVGKNNEGKSNLLRALDVAMTVMSNHNKNSYNRDIDNKYNWKTDFPIQNQNRKSGLETIFKLQFQLNDDEFREFGKKTKLRGNNIIAIEIRIGKNNEPKVSVPKRGTYTYNQKSNLITQFISERINMNYIPAVRTEEQALDILKNVIRSEMRSLNQNQEYVEASKKIQELENVLFEELSERVSPSLREFLPNLKKFSIKSNQNNFINRTVRSIDIEIDDGVSTSISFKGDGIKSLVTLAILKDRGAEEGVSIVAIEEPESHLHPGAIHSLVEVLRNLSEHSQVILTTHNPLFVQQNSIESNIIVNSGTAKPTKKIKEIRDILGILPSDNLENARYVIVVEGEDDKIALQKILPKMSNIIKSKFDSNQLIIKPLGGASKLASELYMLKNNLCKYVVLLDNDDAGLRAKEIAMEKGFLSEGQIRITISQGMREAEFEDCLNSEVYAEKINEEYGINLNSFQTFRNNKKKWSDRVKDVFIAQGINWNVETENKIKLIVARSITSIEDLDDILISQKSEYLRSFVQIIEKMFD